MGDKIQQIYTNTTKTRSEAGAAATEAPAIAPRMEAIKEAQNNIDSLTGAIDKDYGKTVNTTSKELAALKKENNELKGKNAQLYNKWLFTIIIASGLLCAVSIALVLLGHFKSFTLTVISGSVLLGAIALQFLLQYLLWIGLAVTIIIAAVVVFAVWQQRMALKQTVKTVEQAKPLITDKETFVKTANSIQSKTTKTIVDQYQKRLKKESNGSKKGTVGRIINKLW